jgi:hypothetical protein
MPRAAALALVVLAGCSSRPTGGPAAPPAPAADVVPLDAAPPAIVYQRAPSLIVTPEVAPGTLDWNRPVLSIDQLSDALDDVDGAKARLGRFIVRTTEARFDRYDPATGTLPFVGNGLAGLDSHPPLSLSATASVTRGEMPMGGHARLDIGYLRGAITIDAAGAQAVLDAQQGHELVMHFLVDLDRAGTVDGADVVVGTLRGVRVVLEGPNLVYLEGTPTKLGR